MNNNSILATYINTDQTALIEVTYDAYPKLPIDNDDLPYRIYIETLNTDDSNQSLINELFNDDPVQYKKFHGHCHDSAKLCRRLNEIAASQNKTVIPIDKYQHRAVRYYLSANDSWDMSTVGFAVIDSTDPTDVDHLAVDIENTLDRVTDYANGDVYYVTEYSLNPIHHTKEGIIDSCDGIYACLTTANVIGQPLADTGDDTPVSIPNATPDFNYQNIHDVVAVLAEQPKNWHPAKTITTVSYDFE